MKKLLFGLLLAIACVSCVSTVRVDEETVVCDSFADKVFLMAKYADANPTATREQVIQSTKTKDNVELMTLSARMILTHQGRMYRAEDHLVGSLTLCQQREGNVANMIERIKVILLHFETEEAGKV